MKFNFWSRVQVVVVIAGVGLSSAMAGSIDTDGPDFVDSSEAVGLGRFQYEAELASVWDRRNASHTTRTATPLLLRYGVTETLEIRLDTEGHVRQSGDTQPDALSGTGETALGVKWHSQDGDESRGIPSVSWILDVAMPWGSKGLAGRGTRPSLRSVVTWELPHDLALGIMPGLKSDTGEDGHRFTSGIFGAVLNKKMNENFRAFVEVSTPQLARSRNGGVLANWDLGAAYLLTNDTQLGVRSGIAANHNTPTSYLLVELAQRF
jgi:hypothetical protein